MSSFAVSPLRTYMLRTVAALVALFPFLLAPHADAQQSYVGLFDLYGGFAYLDSPSVKLQQRGGHLQAGINYNSWLALGFDYSRLSGHTDITPNLLTTTLQTQLGTQIAGLEAAGIIPPNYNLIVPFDATTETFAAGPQLMIRHWSAVTLFVRPSIGAIHEVATLHATDPFSAGVVAQLAPGGSKTDWTGFYGFGGGAEFNFGPHFSLRAQADFVHNHLFSDVLKNPRNTVRLSIGPAIHFGPNRVK
ncbi:MAG TPA: outer membrane beta-barrel protein [Bryobacteraceae bacterium]|nr:outer membrane beta-barrel protein [Bryobacteraceae bacterium]